MSYTSPQIYRFDRILGLVDDELTPELFRRWGGTLGRMLPPESKFVVVRDNRAHSEEYKEELVQGLIAQGVYVVDLGMLPYDLVPYHLGRYEAFGYASVGGGSRPHSWNGLRWKLLNSDRSCLEQVRQLRVEAESPVRKSKGTKPGTKFLPEEGIESWMAWLSSIWYDTPRVPLKIIVDPMHGNWSSIAGEACRNVFPHMEFKTIHDKADPGFGGLIPDARHWNSLRDLRRAVQESDADLGVAFEGDAGLFTIFDDQGVPLSQDEFAWIVLNGLLGPALENETFVHNVNFPSILVEIGKKHGGKPIVVPHREDAIMSSMRESRALIGFGSDGELFFRGAMGNRIVGFAFCWFLDYFSYLSISLSEWRKLFPPIFTTPEIHTPIASLEEIASRIGARWNAEPVRTIEGISFPLRYGRVNVRTLLDYGLLGFHFEAGNREHLEHLVEGCADTLKDLDHIGLVLKERFQSDPHFASVHGH